MRRLFILLLFVLLVAIGCAGKKPPEPTPPPPDEVCGNAVCAGGETNATCPADCPAGPPPPPPPPHECQAQKPLIYAATVPDGAAVRSLANYGLLSQTGLDAHEIAIAVMNSPFDTVGIHLTSFWGQLKPAGNQPFKFDVRSGKYLLKQAEPNPEWHTQTKDVFWEFACHGNTKVHLSLFDQYLEDKNISAAAGLNMFAKHWGRDNDIGVRWLSAKPLYDSWNGQTRWEWLWWPSDDTLPSTSYKCDNNPSSSAGAAMCKAIRDAYLRPLAKNLFDVQAEFKNWHWSYKVFNEEKGRQEWVKDPKTGKFKWHSNRGKSLGGETKIHRWVYEQIFLKAGFTRQQLDEHIDTLAWKGFVSGSEYGWDVEWGNMYKTFRYVTQSGTPPPPKRFAKARFEVHNVNSTSIIKLWQSQHTWKNPDGSPGSAPGITGPDVFWSADAAAEDVGYLPRMRLIYKYPVERAEIKTFTDPTSIKKCWDNHDMPKSVRLCWPIIFKAMQQ